MPLLPVLSHIQAAQLLDARGAGQPAVTVSPDLGLTRIEAALGPDGVSLAGSRLLSWPEVEEIAAHENACFALRGDGLQPVQAFSAVTNRFCSLMPTASAPTLLIAGFPMHRIKHTDPHRDTLSKIRALGPISGHVLDTTTGLGYTAIEASLRAGHVTTIELDPAVLEVARLNPWSQRLFDNPKITQLVGDAAELIEDMADEAFSRIIHDPPTLSLAGDLYSGAFYRQLFRVLARGGRLFHYLGDPNSTSGRRVGKGAVRRLREAGFARVRPCPEAFGVVAHKS
ncbi:MAG: spermine synthase [Armatimonadetes bacterium]|nr:spermine synthase [Armatimonadota bacterium]